MEWIAESVSCIEGRYNEGLFDENSPTITNRQPALECVGKQRMAFEKWKVKNIAAASGSRILSDKPPNLDG